MLKRRSRIQKYISTLKKKQLKKDALRNHTVLKYKIENDDGDAKVEHEQPQIEIEEEAEQACWNDPDDEPNAIELPNANKFRKLAQFGLQSQTTEEDYERKLGKLYKQKYQKVNWAQEADGIE